MSTSSTRILGISAYYHDSAAALVVDGTIAAAAEEERFSRRKHDARFPCHAIEYCLSAGKICIEDVEWVVFYDKPFLKFERLLESYLTYAPLGLTSFLRSTPIWLKEKLYLKQRIRNELRSLRRCKRGEVGPILFSEHHRSHAASAFFASPFERAAVICVDGVGEWATTSVWLGSQNALSLQWQLDFPHSIGLLYSAMTFFAGFEVNSDEYKLMGLAPYGEPRYVDLILEKILDLKSDGTFRLEMSYFDYPVGSRMTSKRMNRIFGGPPRAPGAAITQREMDIARSIQVVTEEILLRLVNTAYRELSVDKLCLAGGVALNCVANGRICREGPFADVWVQPAAGDSGGAIGAALSVWHEYLGQPRLGCGTDLMKGTFLGPEFSSREIQDYLDSVGACYTKLDSTDLPGYVARLLAQGNVVGWFQGRMEFGPRALGKRSILGDPRNVEMQSKINLKVKRRESFRPFAPAVVGARAAEYFELDRSSPYMMLAIPVRDAKRKRPTLEEEQLLGLDRLKAARSEIAAVTHIDYSARAQTVEANIDPLFHELIAAFEGLTGVPVLLNTSFNVKGEPIVCSPRDALRCFMRTDLDYLAIGNMLLTKVDQPTSMKLRFLHEEAKRELPDDGVSKSVGFRGRSIRLPAFLVQAFLLIGLVFVLLRPQVGWRVPVALTVASAASALAAVNPAWGRAAIRAWTSTVKFVNRIISYAILAVVFVAVLTPIALLRRGRWAKRNPIDLRINRLVKSYRVVRADGARFDFSRPF